MTPWQMAALGVVCLAAGAAQTVAGFGLSLIVAPIAQTITPGTVAVRLVVGLSAIVNSGILARSWRQVLWRPATLIIVPTLVATLIVGPRPLSPGRPAGSSRRSKPCSFPATSRPFSFSAAHGYLPASDWPVRSARSWEWASAHGCGRTSHPVSSAG